MSTDTAASETTSSPRAMPAAGRAPVAPPAAGYLGALLAVLFIAAGCVALRDAFIAAQWIDGALWIESAIDWIDGLSFSGWMTAAAIGLLLIGGWMLYSALRPRRKIAVQIEARSGIWIAPTDLARLASSTAQTVPGVLDARSRATRRKIVITVRTTDARNPDIAKTTQQTVLTRVGDALTKRPKVVIRVRKAS